jgi:16S rRNA (uracil1498-N3)-methyltransferase
MSHIYRFYAEPEVGDAARVVLRDEEAHHALHVLRIKEGQTIHAFGGLGRAWRCVVESASRKEVVCAVVEATESARPAPGVCVSMAWLNKDKSIEALIQRCTELGVGEFRFFRGEHSGRGPKANKKWEKWAVEACKQCGRVWLPTFSVHDSLEDVVRAEEATLVASLGEETMSMADAIDASKDINIVIGPEGDFSEGELATLVAQGALPVTLGDAVYRSQVAATIMATLVMYELGRLG